MTYYLEKSIWYCQTDIPEGMNLQMLNDQHRLDVLLGPSIVEQSAGQTVIDLGCGTGLLGLTAIQQGAEFVYFVERDPQMFYILQSTLPNLLQPHQYCLINSDIESLKAEDFVGPTPSLVISEFYGPTLFDEGYIFYVRHLKSLFNNLKFIPEQFDVEVTVCDVDYSLSIWPTNPLLLDHFRFMYSEKGFNSHHAADGYVPTVSPRIQGTLSYNTNSDYFHNTVEIQTIAGIEQLVHCWCVIRHGHREHRFSSYGWFIPSNDHPHKYQITVSIDNDETVLQPQFSKLD
jgi:SAM-dependent methyltransferase